MDELHGDQATWQFDGQVIRIHYHTGWRRDPMLRALGRCEVPVAAIAAVEFNPRTARRRWELRLQLRDRTDPYAAVGAMLTKVYPFRLTGPARTALLAEYWADQLTYLAEQASTEPAPREVATGLVPPVPVHIQTAEGTATFDGTAVRLVFSGSSAKPGKRKAQAREFPLADIRAMEWVPSDGWEWGHLRVLTVAGEPPTKPAQDPTCLRCNEGKDASHSLLLAATVTAHLWTRPVVPGSAALESVGASEPDPPASDPDSLVIYERIRQLSRLHAEGALTDEEFAAKKAELLDRL